MVQVLAIVFVLGLLIFFHELGHFLLARVFGVGVETFSLGFGPRLTGFRRGETDYRISLIPLGGYVKLIGEDPDLEVPPEDQERSFSLKSPWKRMGIVAAGPIFNFLLAWFIYWGIIFAQGQMYFLPKVGQVQVESPAQGAGIRPGDLIVAVEGRPIHYWYELVAMVSRVKPGDTVSLSIRRDGRIVELQVRPEVKITKNIFGEEVKIPRIGIISAMSGVRVQKGFGESALLGLEKTWQLVSLTVEGLIKMVERVIPFDNIGGPIMIAQLVGEQAQQGLADLLALTALISINLGLLNLLPIPVLDGGHILFNLLEIICRRPLSAEVRFWAVRVGMSFLLALMGLAVYNDLYRLIHAGS